MWQETWAAHQRHARPQTAEHPEAQLRCEPGLELDFPPRGPVNADVKHSSHHNFIQRDTQLLCSHTRRHRGSLVNSCIPVMLRKVWLEVCSKCRASATVSATSPPIGCISPGCLSALSCVHCIGGAGDGYAPVARANPRIMLTQYVRAKVGALGPLSRTHAAPASTPPALR